MVFDPFSTGAGGASGLLAAWLIIKAKFNGMGKRLTKVEEDRVIKETCEAVHKGVDERLERIEDGQGEIKDDIKDISKNILKIFGRPCQKPGECDKQ